LQQSSSPNPINQSFNSKRWAHNIASMSFATDSDFVKNILTKSESVAKLILAILCAHLLLLKD
jgi:hypothetical protein